MSTPAERACTDCGTVKPLEAFAKGNAAYGRKSYCRACQTLRQQKYRACNAALAAPPPPEKWCPACKRTLPASAFYTARGERTGLQLYCKTCKDTQNQRWDRAHHAERRVYRAAHHRMKWQHHRVMAKAWRKNNRLRDREYFYRYYSRKRGTQVGKVNYAAILERDGGICYLCKLSIPSGDLHFDHVIPLSRGGAHVMENIRATHARCNLSKGDKTPEEYLAAS